MKREPTKREWLFDEGMHILHLGRKWLGQIEKRFVNDGYYWKMCSRSSGVELFDCLDVAKAELERKVVA